MIIIGKIIIQKAVLFCNCTTVEVCIYSLSPSFDLINSFGKQKIFAVLNLALNITLFSFDFVHIINETTLN